MRDDSIDQGVGLMVMVTPRHENSPHYFSRISVCFLRRKPKRNSTEVEAAAEVEVQWGLLQTCLLPLLRVSSVASRVNGCDQQLFHSDLTVVVRSLPDDDYIAVGNLFLNI